MFCAVNPAICACDISYSLITLTQPQVCLLLPGERGNAVFSVPPWRVSVMQDLSVQCDTGAEHGSCCLRRKPVCPPCSLHVLFQLLLRTPLRLRETLTFELLSCHFLLLENRKEKRALTKPTLLHLQQVRDLSIHKASIHHV